MNILFVGRQHGRTRTLELNAFSLSLMLLLLGLFVSACLATGYMIGEWSSHSHSEKVDVALVNDWKAQLVEQEQALQLVKRESQAEIDALTREMGKMHARLLRLDALGERLTESAKLDKGEFDFSREPPLGGPAMGAVASLSSSDLKQHLEQLDNKLTDRQKQLDILFYVLDGKRLENERFIAGRPIKKGWMSSGFGYRSDPFTGKRAWHAGVDFAGKEGGDIIAVASGVVTFSGERYGYGNMIEINHGNGYATRYAHCKTLNAQVGDVVSKGDVIAELGSTGRSTGPHVHLEILRHSKPIDPEKFVWRKNRS